MVKASKRVFISHTSELTHYPEKKSFIDAAVAAVNRAGMVPCDMGYFTARDEKPAKYCEQQVRQCEIYLGIIGFRYGSTVRDQPEVSYTELEFNTASEAAAITRLIFLLDPRALVPIGSFSDTKYGDRQEVFRKQLSDSGLTCKPFTDVHELEKLIYQALVEIIAEIDKSGQAHIQWPETESPYPGLEWFDDKYAALFFGREREVAEVISKMNEPQGRFLVVSGASGSGKSSLVGAGVWRALIQEERMPSGRKCLWLRIQPGDENTLFGGLARGLKQTFPKIAGSSDVLAAELTSDETKFTTLLLQHMNSGQELVLFVDQLEALFTRRFEKKEVIEFIERLVNVASNPANRLHVLATLRTEFVTRLQESEPVRALLNAGYLYHLGPVSPRTLQDMIEKPAQATGYEFDPGLVEEILKDAPTEAGQLPLVAYTLRRLFEDRKGVRFTRESYLTMGKVAGAIGTQAERVLASLNDPKVSKAFDRLFSGLVLVERDRPPTRRRMPLDEVGSNASVRILVEALASPDCRILVTNSEQNNPSVELAHEKLLTAWPRLRGWIEKQGDALRIIEHASEEARRWQTHGAKPRDLWSADRAGEVSAALTRFGKTPSLELDRFLHPQQTLIEQLDSMIIMHVERALIGSKLAEFGDCREGVGLTELGIPNIEWVDIPKGPVQHADVKGMFNVKPFRIARFPVTNAQFEAFRNADDGYCKEQWWRYIVRSRELKPSKWPADNCPRTDVSWYEAVAFCRWLGARLGGQVRLPMEWEWQQAATGGDPKREYPWDGGWNPAHCNSNASGLHHTTPVGVYPKGKTLQGVLDMAGNVWEWCFNKHKNPMDSRVLNLDPFNEERVVRGGSWYDVPEQLLSSTRNSYSPDGRYDDVGFRPLLEIG